MHKTLTNFKNSNESIFNEKYNLNEFMLSLLSIHCRIPINSSITQSNAC